MHALESKSRGGLRKKRGKTKNTRFQSKMSFPNYMQLDFSLEMKRKFMNKIKQHKSGNSERFGIKYMWD